MAAKRSRKVAFKEEVDIQDKKTKQSEGFEESSNIQQRSKLGCGREAK